MNMTEIIAKHSHLSHQLAVALSTMERKDRIRELREQLIDLQNQCPHFSNEYGWAIIDDECPYCGKKLNR